ncbi:sugar transferase [Clostridium sp. HBUAS56017]|uniref:sugar transferase n=1 Tax=Clostridium sp. HBUAS56017 TaxID=2571128 RepID=UPI00117815F0|nr:sugar transferase [Clostridium sp. HBUAS56017]
MYKRFFKRVLDLILSILALPFLLIIVVVVGPIIYIQDKKSIFFVSPRLGHKGKIYKMYKFRTMKMNAPDIRNEDGSTFNSKDDYRLTYIGKILRKTSIDETPQILNVIKGDMSIIGPRPDLPEHLELYVGNERRKLEIKPGITGFNQAYYRNTVGWKQRIEHDIYYIDHLSFGFDIKIFLKTIKAVLKRENLYVVKINTKMNKNI